MRARRISLRTAAMIPFILVVLIIVLMFLFLLSSNYKYLINEQGSKVMRAISDSTEERLKNLMAEPLRITKLTAGFIARDELYAEEDLVEVESYIQDLSGLLQEEMPQISAIAYGDEQARFAGIRFDASGNNNLMLSDKRTGGNLVIFEEENMASSRLAEYEDYDPRTRPWYDVVKKDRQVSWSEVYVNYDEKMEATITAMSPITGSDGGFKGVMGTDVKLTGINDFLKTQLDKQTNSIYIVDKDWNLLAHSGNEAAIITREGNPPVGELMKAVSSENLLISESSSFLMNNRFELHVPIQLDIDGANHFVLVSQLEEPQGLGWRSVIVIPEDQLMGLMISRKNLVMLIALLIALIGCAVGFITLSKVMEPVIRSSRAAVELSAGNWDTKLETGSWPLKETGELVAAFNNMAASLKGSFEQIELKEERYRTLVENVENMIYSISPEGKFISLNSSFEKTLGRSREELIGKDFLEIFDAEESKSFWMLKLKEVNAERKKLNMQYEYTDEKGGYRALSVILIPLLNEAGQLQLILGSNMDITDLIKAQNEIRHLHEIERERLEKLIQDRTEELKVVMKELVDKEKLASLGGIVSGLAQEINTPLGVAVAAASYLDRVNKSNMELVEEGSITRADFTKFIDTMEETAAILNTNLGRAAELVKSFKLIAVSQSNEMKSSFNLCSYIHTLLPGLKHEYKNSDIVFDIRCPEDLVINSYSGAFSQIFTNLIMNSLIHGFKGRDRGMISITVRKEAELLNITYSDNGIGIPSENLDKIFEPFFTTNRSAGGSGLGLSLIYNLVTGQLGGRITCQSTLGEGTTFNIEIPKDGPARTGS